jgi:RNA polymerase sigma factor (sigma-70 family)
MATIHATFHGIIRHLRERPRDSDGDLLARFVRSRDETAFEEIVLRHGPMVLAVCRRVLGRTSDAEDAFQATFLVLVRRAAAVRQTDLLANWLCSVAYRTARHALRRRYRTGRHERQVERLPEPAFEAQPPADWRPRFDAAFQRLPVKYREPMLLCELQGYSRADAARQLGLNEGTLSCRLARGREMLKRKLGPGFALGSAMLTATVLPDALTAAVRPLAAAGPVPISVLQLAEGVSRTMFTSRLKLGLILIGFTVVTGIGWRAAAPTATAVPADPPPARVAPPPKADAPAKPVAVIDGDTALTREEFADYLIRRYGAEKLEQFTNLRIIETACARKGITVTEAEIDAAIRDDLKSMNLTEEAFRTQVLKKYNKNLVEWREDVIRPRLLMTKLSGGRVAVSDDELRRAFENKYGRKVKCRLIVWAKSEEQAARRAAERLRTNPDEFDALARTQTTAVLAAHGGHVEPFGRDAVDTAGPVIADAAFRLKPGEISDLLTVGDQLMIVKCDGHVPSVEGKRFDTEKPFLVKEVLDRKMAKEIPTVFRQLKDAARPKLLLEK